MKSPKVGIFWLVNGRLLFDSTPVHEAENYAHFKTHPLSHIDHWSKLQDAGIVSRDVEYEEWPRGRVVYDTVRGHFVLFGDVCIIRKPNLVKEIMKELHLPFSRTEKRTDDHYRCFRCIGYQT
jgi:hypothetical protein